MSGPDSSQFRNPHSTIRILVDADACPVRDEVGRVAERCGVKVLYFANSAQGFEARAGGRVVQVPDGRDGADFAMVAECRDGDITVTDDIGLAAMLLPKGAAVLSSRGRRFLPEQIPLLLAQRHVARKARRAGKRIPGPRALTPADRRRFVKTLESLLQDSASRA